MYVMIENVGECPVEGFTLFGMSMTRYSGNVASIGKFGTGLKHGVMTLMRNGLDVVGFAGRNKVQYYTEDVTVQTDIQRQSYKKLHAKVNGKRHDMSVVLEHGALDWNSSDMALREFIANAIDSATARGLSMDTVRIEKCGPGKVLGEEGKTRIFVELGDKVHDYIADIKNKFLHFSGQQDKVILDNPKHENVKFYKKGVYVRSLDVPSLFHYNLSDLHIDETRNSDSGSCRNGAASALFYYLSYEQIVTLFKTITDREANCFEKTLSEFYMYVPGKRKAEIVKAWKEATNDAVLCGPNETVLEFLRKKGHHCAVVPASFYTVLSKIDGVRTDFNFCTENNEEVIPPTDAMVKAVQKAWDICSIQGTCGRAFPKVAGFAPMMNAESQIWGKYKDKTVYIHKDCGGDILNQVALEEVIHHITGATDMSRDFQMYMIRLIATIGF